MASSITKAIRLSVPVLSTNASRMLSTIAKMGLSETAAAADQNATAAVTDQKARLSTVAPFPEYPPVNDSKDNISQSDLLLPEFLYPQEFLNWYAKLLLKKGVTAAIQEAMKYKGHKVKIDSDGLMVQVYTSGFEHKDLKVEFQDSYLVVQGETTDMMGKPLKCNKHIWIPSSEAYDKEKLKADSKNGLLRVVAPFLNKAKALN
ncbi:hypothetical protein CTI12_AA090280 [Artemisia annua]|uniref:SHSP domain-containing protein n=1 Tax=Artemisia annua TaxID=35608 RepID=A0A2U1Q0C8_ARTAN|nr:hypothetical protein CTI12_AA090280 [Artemisia annua]